MLSEPKKISIKLNHGAVYFDRLSFGLERESRLLHKDYLLHLCSQFIQKIR